MRISEQRKLEIASAFQRSIKRDNQEEIESISLIELRQANEMLGNRDVNSSFRMAMQSRINSLEKREQRQRESKMRAWGWVVGILISLLVASLVKLLFK